MEVDEPRLNRFKHQSYAESLKSVHVPSILAQTPQDNDLKDHESHFHSSLEHWQQLNLSPSFIQFAKRAGPLSASLPLLLHNWQEVVQLWVTALDESDDEGLRAVLDLFQKLTHDLRTTIAAAYLDPVLPRLLSLLHRSKTVSTSALTALLATFASVFKFLLVPACSEDDSTLLDATWREIRDTLPRCLPEVQRALAEVWGGVIRRLKSSVRERAVVLLCESVADEESDVQDAVAWAVVYACQSVSQTLHTCAPSVVGPLVHFHVFTSPSSSRTHTLLKRSLTALIHHVRNADNFSVVADILVDRLVSLTAEQPDAASMRSMVDLMSIATSVRSGTRLTPKHANSILKAFPSLFAIYLASPSDQLSASLLHLATAALMATPEADSSFWMGKGREMLDALWNMPDREATLFSISLTGALAELGWPGWRAIGLPLTFRASSKILSGTDDQLQTRTVALLAQLWRAKKFTSDGDVVWRNSLETWSVKHLGEMKNRDVATLDWDQAGVLSNILTLSSSFSQSSGISAALISLTDAQLAQNEPLEGVTPLFVGMCMRALSQRSPTEWKDLKLTKWVEQCTQVDIVWATSPEVLEALAALLSTSAAESVDIELMYPALAPAILSNSRPLRLAALRLLAATRPSDAREVVKRCLAGEEVPLEVQGVRERVLRIGRVESIVKDKEKETDIGPDVCARWLIAQLKVNLRPLWSPAAGALAQMSQRFGDDVWGLVFAELQQVYANPNVVRGPSSDPIEDTDDVREDERSWRDPNAYKLRTAVRKWLDSRHHVAELMAAADPSERFDPQSYESQLLFALGESPELVQKHNRDIVSFFLELVSSESKLARHKLASWLTLFSKLSNPKALYATDALRNFYLSTLSYPDRNLQSSALSCVLSYKSPHLVPHESQLRTFLDDTRWRDELSRLDLTQVQSHDRVEVIDVLIRLLFGMMLEKKGRSRGADRRAAILSAFAGCTDVELGLLVDLMLKSFGDTCNGRRDSVFAIQTVPSTASGKQQIGFLSLLGEVIKHLGSRIVKYWPVLLGRTMDCIAEAQSRIAGSIEDVELDNSDAEDDDPNPTSSPTKKWRTIRQLGLKRLADFFRCQVDFDFDFYMPVAFETFISPRLPALDKENTQAPSALLELFNVWTLNVRHITFLTQYDQRLLPQIYACLTATNVKPAVVSKVFDMVEKILDVASIENQVSNMVMKPHVSILLQNLASLVERSNITTLSSPLGQRQIGILASIAQYSTNASQASTLLTLFTPLLLRPAKVVPEKVKGDLLTIIGNQMALISDLKDANSQIYAKTFELLSRLLQSLRSRPARLALIAAFRHLSALDASLDRIVDILDSLNAYSARRVDEPDFERRLSAFVSLNETLFGSLSVSEWLPVIYSMLHSIQDPAELAIRTSSAFSLRHFIDLVATGSVDHETMFLRVLYPGIKNGLHSRNELVRGELLGVLAYAVHKCDSISPLQDMRVLLAGGDEEANFFNNIHHIQIHRRSRALRRLGDHCDEGQLRSSTLAEIMVPLVANYIADTTLVDHHLVNDAITATGRMAKHLSWGAYYALVQKYLRLSRAKDASERVYIRTLVAILDNFHFSMEQSIPAVEVGQDGNNGEEDSEDDVAPVTTPATLQSSARIADAVNLRLLPNLLNHLEKRDEKTDDTTRIPIAVGIVRVALHLPVANREAQVSRLLTILSQVFRSRSQETRDLTRETLARITVSLGPTYLPLVFRELRAALLRGPQLHVLAYVTHSLLVHVSSEHNVKTFSTLDDCVSDVAHISAEVIFGESAKDVMAEDFKTKMREAKSSSSKGLDSFGIIARFITPQRLSNLLLPLRAIMHETVSVKMMLLVEEVLRRITTGLNANEHLTPPELLVLCHTLISQNAKFLKEGSIKRKGKPKGDAIVQTKRHIAVEEDHYATNSFRFISFGLELFNTALRRSRFDFHDANIIQRLDSMVVVIGNTLYTNASPVLIAGLKAAAGIVKCPLKTLDKSVPVFVRQILDIIKQAGSTESEVVQGAFKSLATILRDGPPVKVQEKDLVFLLELLTPDLEEPTRQTSAFAILRSVVARKFVVPEIYVVMEKVAEIMVTSQSPQVQELCRSVLLQFLLDYPQGKGRLRTQMTFLAKNLSYEFESGRKSVLELLGAILAKFEAALVDEYADLLFVTLAMSIVNDDSTKCREMSAQLIKTLFSRLDNGSRQNILSHLHSWASQSAQPQLTRVAFQIYGSVIELMESDGTAHVTSILKDVNASLQLSRQELLDTATDEKDAMEVELDWQRPYHSLSLIAKLLRVFPAITTESSGVDWDLIVAHLLFPHSWVRIVSCKLVGSLFAAIPPAPPCDLPPPLSGETALRDIALKLSTQLKSPHLDEALSLQVVKNLFYIGKCFAAGSSPSEEEVDAASDDEEKTTHSNPLPWMFSKLSYQIRSSHIARRNKASSASNWAQQPTAVLRWFAAMAAHMDEAKLNLFLVHILTPVYRITEDDTIRDSQMAEMKTLCVELQDLVQAKVGVTKFSAVYNQIRQGALGMQRERKATRVLQATVNPEAAARRKHQRNVIKKESKKRKGAVLAEGRGKLKRRREE